MKHPGCNLYLHSVHRIADDGFSSRAFCTPLGAEAGAGLTRWVTPACCTLNIEHCVLHIAYCILHIALAAHAAQCGSRLA